MGSIPVNRRLFWTTYTVGSLGPLLGSFLLSRHHVIDSFLLSWLLWLIGAVALIACVWSVRSILFRSEKARTPVWVYRFVAWLALFECLAWAYTALAAVYPL
jgi:hypothetical protein